MELYTTCDKCKDIFENTQVRLIDDEHVCHECIKDLNFSFLLATIKCEKCGHPVKTAFGENHE